MSKQKGRTGRVPTAIKMIKGVEDKLNQVVGEVNHHFQTLFQNAQETANMVYTISVRTEVLRRIVREQLKVDDAAFEALCTQEIEKRKAELQAAQEKSRQESHLKVVEEAAEAVQDDPEEVREFGGDFGQEASGDGAKDGDHDSTDDQPGGDASVDDQRAVEAAGPTSP